MLQGAVAQTAADACLQEAGELLCMMKRDLPGTTSLEEEEQRRSEKLPSRPEGCVQVLPPNGCITAPCC